MIDPVIFSFKLFNLEIVLRWYGVLVMLGAVVGTLIAEREIKRRGENGESIWDGLCVGIACRDHRCAFMVCSQ